jgi:hypothetical protein
MQTRRDLLARSAAFAAAAAFPAGAFAQGAELELDDDLFMTTLSEYGAYNNPLLKRGPSEGTALGRKVKKILSAASPERSIIWTPDYKLSPDFRHLPALESEPSFTLTHAVMERLCAANGFTPVASAAREAKASKREGATGATKVLIGLRGCMTDGPTRGAAIKLKAVTPDHITLKCLIGVWDTQAKTFELFPGSTVPDQGYVLAQALSVDKVADRLPLEFGGCEVPRKNMSSVGFANMGPTGQFTYVVGLHNMSWKAPERRTPPRVGSPGMRDVRQPAAFRQVSLYPTLRVLTTAKDIYYSTGAYWDMDRRSWGVNIHAAYKPKPYWQFDSAGCQVIRGHYSVMDDPNGKGKPAVDAVGDYGKFRVAAGLSATPNFVTKPETWADSLATTDDGKLFYSYLLVTGRELGLHAAATAPAAEQNLKRLRYGSRGPAVTALCQALTKAGFRKAAATSTFDHGVACDVLRWQMCHANGADGIVTPEMAQALGFAI